MTITLDPTIDITIDLTDFQKDFYRTWIPALESGEYTQVQDRLSSFRGRGDDGKDIVGYCCLGVAGCALRDNFAGELAEKGFEISMDGNNMVASVPDVELGQVGDQTILPAPFEEWLGFGEPLGLENDHFTSANDNNGQDFLAIARAVRLALVGKTKEARAILEGNELVYPIDTNGRTDFDEDEE